jgi:hypothetical protein
VTARGATYAFNAPDLASTSQENVGKEDCGNGPAPGGPPQVITCTGVSATADGRGYWIGESAHFVANGMVQYAGVVLAIGAIVHVRDRRQAHDADAVGGAGSGDTWADTWSLVVITGAIALVAWVFLFFGWSALAPRLAYLALPLWAALVGLTAQAVGAALPRIRPALPSAALVIMVALCVWSLHAVHSAEATLHLIADL